jgi:hypothetical protein
MKRNKTRCGPAVIAGTVLAVGGAHQSAHAVTFGDENFKGSFDSTISVGMGVRTRSPSPSRQSTICPMVPWFAQETWDRPAVFQTRVT